MRLLVSLVFGALACAAVRPAGPSVPEEETRETDVGSSGFARLTRDHYRATVRDLFGLEVSADELPGDEKTGPFEANSSSPITFSSADRYRRAAQRISGLLDTTAFVRCTPAGAADATCAEAVVRGLGRRIYRRPLDPAEVAGLLDVFRLGARESGAFAGGIRLAAQAMLSSPRFLYRIEVGTPGPRPAVVRRTPHEMAARLSFFLWGTTPDGILSAAADAGALTTRPSVGEHAARMLADPRADGVLRSFVRQWLGLDELPHLIRSVKRYPQFPSLALDMVREAEDFAVHVFRKGDRTLTTLMTAPYTIATPRLAKAVYGTAGTSTVEGETVRVNLDPAQRAGLLTGSGLMTVTAHQDQTSPVLRGVLIRERFLCQDLPSPPDNVNNTPPRVKGKLSARERWSDHTLDVGCGGCHKLIDPIGFGFESYDPLGRFRTVDAGHSIDARGEIAGTDDVAQPFDGAVDLARRLARSTVVQRCFARQWARLALSREPGPADARSMEEVHRAFARSGLDVRALVLALVTSDAFRFRRGGT